MTKNISEAYYPYQVKIDTYGNGGFRFADMSHKGGLICLPSGVYAWTVQNLENLMLDDFSRILSEADSFEFLLLGTGIDQSFVSKEIQEAFNEANLGLDVMNTGAACRTYNVLLAEKRPVGVAVLPVE